MRPRNPIIAAALILGLVLGVEACERESQEGAADDDIEISIPEDADERLEEAGREVGEAVGEGMESVGGAIEEAGREVQEEVQEGRAEEDTVRM
jgi:hypothetical protein